MFNNTQYSTRQYNTIQCLYNTIQNTHPNTMQCNTRSDNTRHDKKRHHKSRPVQTRPDKTRQDKTGQDKTRQDKTRQDRTRQDKTRHNGLVAKCELLPVMEHDGSLMQFKTSQFLSVELEQFTKYAHVAFQQVKQVGDN